MPRALDIALCNFADEVASWPSWRHHLISSHPIHFEVFKGINKPWELRDYTYFVLNHTANLWDEVLRDDAVQMKIFRRLLLFNAFSKFGPLLFCVTNQRPCSTLTIWDSHVRKQVIKFGGKLVGSNQSSIKWIPNEISGSSVCTTKGHLPTGSQVQAIINQSHPVCLLQSFSVSLIKWSEKNNSRAKVSSKESCALKSGMAKLRPKGQNLLLAIKSKNKTWWGHLLH